MSRFKRSFASVDSSNIKDYRLYMRFLIKVMLVVCLLTMVNLSLHAAVHIDHASGDSAALIDCQSCQTYDSLADHGTLNYKPLAIACAPYPDLAVNNLARHRHPLFYARAPPLVN